MPAKKGQTFNRYSEEMRKRLFVCEWKKVRRIVETRRSLELRATVRLSHGS